MNEETKNTLDYINEFMNAPLEQVYLNKKRIKLVLNYITDLQQENTLLKEIIEKAYEYIKKHTIEYKLSDYLTTTEFSPFANPNELLKMLEGDKTNDKI